MSGDGIRRQREEVRMELTLWSQLAYSDQLFFVPLSEDHGQGC